MSALTRHQDSPLWGTHWQADVVQLSDEHHMAAWSASAHLRVQFAASVIQFLACQRDTEVCVLYGRFITDLESFCHQLERLLPGGELERRIDGPDGVIALLRARHSFPGRTAPKYRYYIWHDADVLLRQNPSLFGRIVDALAGVAAEAEYVSDDLLLIHRVIFVGGAGLDAYCEDETGQIRSWYDDGLGEPFWQLVTGIDKPPFIKFHIDALSVVHYGVPLLDRPGVVHVRPASKEPAQKRGKA